jgi:hypothetical protein
MKIARDRNSTKFHIQKFKEIVCLLFRAIFMAYILSPSLSYPLPFRLWIKFNIFLYFLINFFLRTFLAAAAIAKKKPFYCHGRLS